jgi:putative protease
VRQWQVCAIVESCDENGLAVCSLRNKFAQGDALEAVGPDTKPFGFTAGSMHDMDGAPLTEPRTPQMRFTMQLPKQVPAHSMIRRNVDLSAK